MKTKEDIIQLEKTLSKLENLNSSFDYLRLNLASPKRVKSWSERILPDGEVVGEVLKAETINFRTHQPEINGLFCEKIFGPIQNWKCKCGKYNGFVLDKICDECKVEIIEARVRRYRMGFIDLTCPVTHLWYLKGIPSYLCVLLRVYEPNLTVDNLEGSIYMREGEPPITKENGLYRFLKINENKNELNLFTKENSTIQFKTEKTDLNIYKNKKRLGSEIIKAALENINL
ncbi:MAG: DNA-directed RNA polymerase subunit gamma, partial [Verrucomicrobiota bacterium]|nr:DNA-directed RNA polymerase subunit gamma [Verrucomicrobiota bacterium]